MGRLFPRQLARVRSPRYAGSSRIGWDGGGWELYPVLECTAPAAPGERPHRAVAPAPARPGWRTSRSPAPVSPHPADTGSESPRPPPRQPRRDMGQLPGPGWEEDAGRALSPTAVQGLPLRVGGGWLPVWGSGAAGTHLQDGPIDAQQHLPGLVPHAEDVLRQRALEQQVAEPPAAGTGWSGGCGGATGWGGGGGGLGHAVEASGAPRVGTQLGEG